jgi:hypothetical protein
MVPGQEGDPEHEACSRTAEPQDGGRGLARSRAKTLDLINEHVQVEVPRTDMETIVLDAKGYSMEVPQLARDSGGTGRHLQGW